MSDEKDKAMSEIANAVYRASVGILERLEHEGKIVGNGHHAAQELAQEASAVVEDRWI